MSTYDVLKSLLQFAISGDTDADLQIEADHIDQLILDSLALLPEFFPDTASDLLGDWERVYDLSSSGTTAERRARLLVKVQERGGLSRAYFESLALAMGFTISIAEGGEMFRAGISLAGDALHGSDVIWVWTVTATGSGSQTELESVFNRLKPAHTRVEFVYT